jgi:hypothetical protein
MDIKSYLDRVQKSVEANQSEETVNILKEMANSTLVDVGQYMINMEDHINRYESLTEAHQQEWMMCAMFLQMKFSLEYIKLWYDLTAWLRDNVDGIVSAPR